MVKIILNFVKSLRYCMSKELTAEEEQEVLEKIFAKIKES